MKRPVILNILLLFVTISLSAHPWKPRHYVIIDTDGGLDDQKAICMLLASPDVRVMAVTVSSGFNSEKVAYANIRSLLDGLRHEGLPVASGKEAAGLIEKCLSEEAVPVTFISLGSLKTAATAMDESPSFTKKVKLIMWSNDGLPGKEGLNYRSAPDAAERVLAGPLPVTVAGKGGSGFYDREFINELEKAWTPYARKVVSVITANSTHPFVYTCFDEMIPILLHYPSLFSTELSSGNNRLLLPIRLSDLRPASVLLLSGKTVQRMQTIKNFSSDTSFYMADIQPYIAEIQKKYGEDEWTSGVIANELHRHLGVFAIIGVKMGIRAREYFCTGVDEMRVRTLAGSTPPLSCMNDGLQVSTGATPGHGLLEVSQSGPFIPAAEFTHKGVTIRITLKRELADKVTSELKEINFVYGLDSEIYWELVRKNSIKYWQQFDRHEIFDIEVTK